MKKRLIVAVAMAIASPAAAQTTADATSRWTLAVSKSPMDDSPTVVISELADAPVRVWLKTVTPRLILRCKEKALDTYVLTNSAARVERGEDRTVRLRFDTAAAETQGWLQANDHTALFAPAPAEFLDRVRRASRLLFQFEPFNAPPVTVSFSTKGLNANVQKLIAACPAATRTHAQRLAEEKRQDDKIIKFGQGSTRADVIGTQGEPDSETVDGKVMFYGTSRVYLEDGVVVRWANGNPPLHVRR